MPSQAKTVKRISSIILTDNSGNKGSEAQIGSAFSRAVLNFGEAQAID
jgi:hypothetical protein